MNDTLIGVLAGGAITTFFTYIFDVIKYKREEKIYNKHKREDCYIKLLAFVNEYYFTHDANQSDIQFTRFTKDYLGVLLIYASNDVINWYTGFNNSPSYQNLESIKLGDLYKIIRKELGIENINTETKNRNTGTNCHYNDKRFK